MSRRWDLQHAVENVDNQVALLHARVATVDKSRAALTLAQQTHRMQSAAGELRFESAAKIKTYLDQLSHFAKGPFRFVRRLEDFRFVTLQRGPRPGTAKVFLIRGGRIRSQRIARGENGRKG